MFYLMAYVVLCFIVRYIYVRKNQDKPSGTPPNLPIDCVVGPEEDYEDGTRYTVHLSGEQHWNGFRSRQGIIKRMKIGAPLSLVRETRNRYDPNAIRVDYDSRTIGYISKKNAAWVAPLLDGGIIIKASVADVFMDTTFHAPEKIDGEFVPGYYEEFLNVKTHLDGVPSRSEVKLKGMRVEIIHEFIAKVDEKRKTWKGQRKWLESSQQKIDDFLLSKWMDDCERCDLLSLREQIVHLIQEGDRTGNKTIEISIKKKKMGLSELSIAWCDS